MSVHTAISDGLKVTGTDFEKTGTAGVLKPVYGALGTQHVEFRVHEEYSGSDSELAGKEVSRKTEILMITNDKFSRIPKRVSDLSTKEQMVLAPLYQRFKEQKDSTDTNTLTWEACTQEERAHLGNMGVWSVEQLSHFGDHELYKLGPNGKDLRERAIRHMKSKEEKVQAKDSQEIAILRAELEEMKARISGSSLEKDVAKAKEDMRVSRKAA